MANIISLENVKIAFRNFSGEEKIYNKAGSRNFCVILDLETAEALSNDGWNVRYSRPKDEEGDPLAYLQVEVKYNKHPPIISLITKNKTLLNEDQVGMLDWADIKTADIVIRPYNWVLSEGTSNERRGTKAYLKAAYITIEEDEFAEKYKDVPVSNYYASKEE